MIKQGMYTRKVLFNQILSNSISHKKFVKIHLVQLMKVQDYTAGGALNPWEDICFNLM